MPALDDLKIDEMLRASIYSLKGKLTTEGLTVNNISEMEIVDMLMTELNLKWFPGPVWNSIKLEYDSLVAKYNSLPRPDDRQE